MTIYRKACRRCARAFETDQGHRANCYQCSPARTQGRGLAVVPALPGPASESGPAGPDVLDGVVESTEQGSKPRLIGEHERVVDLELVKLGWRDTIEGVGAIGLAKDLDAGGLPGTQRTSMLKQLQSIMNEIRGMAPAEPDVTDGWAELALRRAQEA